MAKEYGQLRHDMWSDDDWLNLTVPAQHLYMTLLGDGALTYCGVTDWRPGKLAQRAAENPTHATLLAAQELAYAFFIVIDEDTEEVLVRSYLRHDPILKNPRLAVTMSKEYGAIGSRKIRAAIVWELARLRKENPDWAAWEKPGVKTILRQQSANPKEMDTDLTHLSEMYLPTGLPSVIGNGEKPFTSGLQQQRATATSTSTSTKEDAVPRGRSYAHPVEGAEPAGVCSVHLFQKKVGDCPECDAAVLERADWLRSQAVAS